MAHDTTAKCISVKPRDTVIKVSVQTLKKKAFSELFMLEFFHIMNKMTENKQKFGHILKKTPKYLPACITSMICCLQPLHGFDNAVCSNNFYIKSFRQK